MSPALLAFIAVILCVLFRVLNVACQPALPTIYGRDGKFIQNVMKACPALCEQYTPTRLWGFSGHVQTVVHAFVGRVQCAWPTGERSSVPLPDGSTVTYDHYEALAQHDLQGDFTLAICPGIGNSSESVYIRAFVHRAQCHGYRCVVLNHLGVLSTVKLTSPRIFTYGSTEEFEAMLKDVESRFSDTKVVLVGFSMGGNLITKFLGDDKCVKSDRILGGISICQGYDANIAGQYMLHWANCRRIYLYVMTENMRSIILRNKNMLLNNNMKKDNELDERKIMSAATLPELDEAYTRRVTGFKTLTDFYNDSSCSHFMKTIKHPIIFVNAVDDPVVHHDLLHIPKNFSEQHDNALYIETSYGGHLGYFEDGFLYPNPHTWLDRVTTSLANGIIQNSLPS